ncbi:hypothetical protein EBR21_03730, partial [bacterium]|nr:hypothetical protein [bacterium]
GTTVPIKISVEYEATRPQNDSRQMISKLWQPLYATLATDPLQSATTVDVAGSIGSTTPTAALPYDQLKRFLIHPRDLIANGIDLFTYKRAIRWLTFIINQNGRPIKTGTISLDDPKILEVPPIEIDAVEGDLISASISLLQVDFMTGEDADSFCRSGAPGLVRTWQGYTEQKVSADTGISVVMKQIETTTLHRSVVAFSLKEVDSLRAAEAQQSLIDTSSGMRLEKKLCPVFDFPVKAGNRPDFGFIKLMTFSIPLKRYLLTVESPTYGLKLMPAEVDRPDYQEVDFKVAWDLGITFASIKDPSSEFMKPGLPFEEVLGGLYDITTRPIVDLGQTPYIDSQATQVIITWPVAVKALNPVFNLSRIRPFTYSLTGGTAPVCSTNLFMDDTNTSGKLVLTCTGTGIVAVSLDDGFVADEIGIKSYSVGGGNSISIDTSAATAKAATTDATAATAAATTTDATAATATATTTIAQ